jgi:hypothetical protein
MPTAAVRAITAVTAVLGLAAVVVARAVSAETLTIQPFKEEAAGLVVTMPSLEATERTRVVAAVLGITLAAAAALAVVVAAAWPKAIAAHQQGNPHRAAAAVAAQILTGVRTVAPV